MANTRQAFGNGYLHLAHRTPDWALSSTAR